MLACNVDDDVDDGAFVIDGTVVDHSSLDAVGDDTVESTVVNVPTVADGDDADDDAMEERLTRDLKDKMTLVQK